MIGSVLSDFYHDGAVQNQATDISSSLQWPYHDPSTSAVEGHILIGVSSAWKKGMYFTELGSRRRCCTQLAGTQSARTIYLTMDKLAAACADESAKVTVGDDKDKIEEDHEEDDDDNETRPWIDWFSPDGDFGIYNNELVQVKDCCARDLCTMSKVSITAFLRCEACGFCCHRSCQLSLTPPIHGLKYNRICKYCAREHDLDADRNSASSDNRKLQHLIDCDFRSLDLQIVSRRL